MQRKFYSSLIFAGILCLSGLISTGAASADLTEGLTVTPRKISIGTFFSGDELTITGNILSSEDILIEIKGKDSESSFDLKGRVGPFWMTVGNVELKHIPELYLLLLPKGPDWEKKAKALGLGIDPLKNRMVTTGTVDIPPDVFKMFAGLKAHEGLYQQVPDAVTYSPETDGTKQFKAVVHLTDKIKTGTYEIRVTTLLNDVMKKQMTDHFFVDEVGFIKLVNHLAMDRRVIYGVSAVIIALLAGLVMGVLFKQSGEAH